MRGALWGYVELNQHEDDSRIRKAEDEGVGREEPKETSEPVLAAREEIFLGAECEETTYYT